MFPIPSKFARMQRFRGWGIAAIAGLLLCFTSSPAFAVNVERVGGSPDRCAPAMAPEAASYQAMDFATFPPFEELLATGNQFFHHVYEQRICQSIENFGTPEGPIALLVLGNEAIAYHDGQREVISGLSPDLYHALKSIGHQALAFDLILRGQPTGNLQENTRFALETQRDLLGKLVADNSEEFRRVHDRIISGEPNSPLPGRGVGGEGWPDDRDLIAPAAEADIAAGRVPNARDLLPVAQASTQQILEIVTAEIETILQKGAIAPEDITEYRQAILPAVITGANLATAAQLTALNTQLGSFFEAVRGRELYVAISSVHQPRTGEVSWQYFSQVLGEMPAIGALGEEHLVFAEGQFTEAALLGTLARHILDREIGGDFFRAPARMQRDLLSDAATQWLWEHQLEIPHLKE